MRKQFRWIQISVFCLMMFMGIIVSPAIANYLPQEGRWMQQDPLEYVDGANLYQSVNSNPVIYVDPTGLFWYVVRDGGSMASANVIASSDTISNLADRIGLEPEEFKEWLTLEGKLRTEKGDKTLSELSMSDKICPNQGVCIPNTALVYWAGEYGGLGKQFIGYNDDRATLRSRGFMVEEVRGLTASGLIDHIQNSMANKYLHGLYYWGHGFLPEKRKDGRYLWSYGAITDHYAHKQLMEEWDRYQKKYKKWVADGMIGSGPIQPAESPMTYMLQWRNINPPYRFGFVIINTCYSNNSDAEDLVSSNGIFYGAKVNTLYPTPFFIDRLSVADIIPPGKQETQK